MVSARQQIVDVDNNDGDCAAIDAGQIRNEYIDISEC